MSYHDGTSIFAQKPIENYVYQSKHLKRFVVSDLLKMNAELFQKYITFYRLSRMSDIKLP